MPHDTPLISTIVAGLVLAFIFGAIATRLRLPPLVGYLLAGIAVGPFTPGFVADAELAVQLSEIGVILLMFGVGLHFSLKDLLSVRAIALPGAVVQIAGATAMGVGLATLLGWSLGAGLIFGLALSVASTVVLLKALQDRHIVESERGRIAVGWLIVEDIAMVLALVLIPALAPLLGGTEVELHDPFIDLVERLAGIDLDLWGILAITVVKVAAFVGFMLVVGRRVIPWALHLTAHTGSRELFRLAVLAIALGVAAGAAYLFGVSLALGAFFAGMILSESELSHRAAQETLPLRDAFAVLFFVSVGMLFDPSILVESPLPVLGTVFIIIVGKSALAYFIGILFRQTSATAMTISASLAQIGEFSFILATLGVGLGLLPVEGRDLILAGALISILLNPLVFHFSESLRPRAEARAAARHPSIVVPNRVEPDLTASQDADSRAAESEPVEATPTSQTGHIVLVGYGSVGSVVADGLHKQGKSFLLIEDSEKMVGVARAAGIEVVVGNAATPEALALANIEAARLLIVAIPNTFEAGQVVEQSRRLNPDLTIVARGHADEDGAYLRELGANEVLMGAREIGIGMLGWTNGDNAHAAEATRERESFDAVAAALRLQDPPRPAYTALSEPQAPAAAAPQPAPVDSPPEPAPPPAEPEPVPPQPAAEIIPPEPVVAPEPEIERAEPRIIDMEPSAPAAAAEPPVAGEPDAAEPVDEPEPAVPTVTVTGEMPAAEPSTPAPVHFEPTLETEPPVPEADATTPEAEPAIPPQPEPPVEPEPPVPPAGEAARPVRAPSSAPGVPFKPDSGNS